MPSRVVDIGEVISVEYSGQLAGAITYRPEYNDEISVLQSIRDVRNDKTVSNVALPLLANIRIFPIVGEYVLLFSIAGSTYYLPINALNNPFSNKIGNKGDSVKLNSDVKSTFQLNKEKYFITQTNEGDVVLESRFGSSFKFGSTVKSGTNSGNLYSKSDLSKNGDPIVVIRNSPSSPYEDIQNDGASIYMCSSQKIPIDSGKNGFEGITGTWSSLNVNAEAIQAEEIKLNTAQLQVMSGMRDNARNSADRMRASGDVQGAVTADERSKYLDSQIRTAEASSSPVLEAAPPPIDPNVTEICKKIIAYAQADAAVPIVEVPPGSNYSPRINQMVNLCGLNNENKYRTSGEGYYWCAAAVTAWFKAAGADTPPGPASCDNWMKWARQKGIFSNKPVPGAAILYGTLADSNHIGIVERVGSDGVVYTIEGNTSGGAGFTRNGGGHVGFYVGEDSTSYHVLGGNQGDKVSVVRILKKRLVQARRPAYNSQPTNVRKITLAPNGIISDNES
jgi:hypothetical protein